MNFIIRLIITGAVAYGLTSFLPGIHIKSFWIAVVLALVLAILNTIVKPILIILTLPLTILTLGLFLFVINAVIILLASEFIRGFSVDGFWWALLFSLLLSIISSILRSPSKEKE
ncbi:MAG: phage holin family protein [Chitinophagaceae bacterium]